MNPLHETPKERVIRALLLYPNAFCLAEVIASRALLNKTYAMNLMNELEDEGLAESAMVKIDGQKARKAFKFIE